MPFFWGEYLNQGMLAEKKIKNLMLREVTKQSIIFLQNKF